MKSLRLVAIAGAGVLLAMLAALNAGAASTITFDNQSGKPTLVKLVGPSAAEVAIVAIAEGTKQSTNAAAGHYTVKVRYGTPGAYAYIKGDEIDVKETATTESRITITLHAVVNGNYSTRPISEAEFGADGAGKSPDKPTESLGAPDKGNEKDSEPIDQAIKDLKNSDIIKRLLACRVLEKAGPKAEAAIPGLLELLNTESEYVVLFEMVNVFASIGKPAVPGLIDVMSKAGSSSRRQFAVMAMYGIGPDAKAAVVDLIKVMKSDNAIDLREKAAAALIHIAPQDKSVTDAFAVLDEGLKNDDSNIRNVSASDLGDLGSLGKPALPALINATKDSVPSVRIEAACSVVRIDPTGESARNAMQVLMTSLGDTNDSNRHSAVVALGRVGKPAKDAIAALKKISMEDPSKMVREGAKDAMGRIADERKPVATQSADDASKERHEDASVTADSLKEWDKKINHVPVNFLVVYYWVSQDHLQRNSTASYTYTPSFSPRGHEVLFDSPPPAAVMQLLDKKMRQIHTIDSVNDGQYGVWSGRGKNCTAVEAGDMWRDAEKRSAKK